MVFLESAVTVTRGCGHALRQMGSHYQLPLARADVILTVREGWNLLVAARAEGSLAVYICAHTCTAGCVPLCVIQGESRLSRVRLCVAHMQCYLHCTE